MSRVEDTKAYQDMMRMNYETFSDILTSIFLILSTFYHLPFWPEPVHSKTADRKTIIHHHALVQTMQTGINYHVEF